MAIDKLKDAILQLKAIRGVPQLLFHQFIETKAVISLVGEIKKLKETGVNIQEIDLIINSRGGSPHDAFRIVKKLRNNFEVVNVIVPFYAKSAATLVALGGNTLVFDELGELGPLDAQIAKERDDSFEYDSKSALTEESALNGIEGRFQNMFDSLFYHLYAELDIRIPKKELIKLLIDSLAKFYEPLLKQIKTLSIGENNRSNELGIAYARRILVEYHEDEIESEVALAKFLTYLAVECPDHEFSIDYRDMVKHAKAWTKKANEFVNDEYATKLTEVSTILMQMEVDYEEYGTFEEMVCFL